MRFLILCISFFILHGCTENDQKRDVETNTYYAKYLYIYNNYDSLGIDKSTELLDEYIEEFPNAQNAYMFKAWLLAQDGSFDKLNGVLSKALEYDSTNTKIYAYWASLLLKDTNSFQKAQSINGQGFKISNNDIDLLHNKTWIHLFKEENNLALNNALKVCSADTLDKYIYTKAALISSVKDQNDSIFSSLSSTKKVKSKDSLDLFLFKNNDLSLMDLYDKTIEK